MVFRPTATALPLQLQLLQCKGFLTHRNAIKTMFVCIFSQPGKQLVFKSPDKNKSLEHFQELEKMSNSNTLLLTLSLQLSDIY